MNNYLTAHQADVRTLFDLTKEPEQKLLLSLHLKSTLKIQKCKNKNVKFLKTLKGMKVLSFLPRMGIDSVQRRDLQQSGPNLLHPRL